MFTRLSIQLYPVTIREARCSYPGKLTLESSGTYCCWCFPFMFVVELEKRSARLHLHSFFLWLTKSTKWLFLTCSCVHADPQWVRTEWKENRVNLFSTLFVKERFLLVWNDFNMSETEKGRLNIAAKNGIFLRIVLTAKSRKNYVFERLALQPGAGCFEHSQVDG